MHDVVVVGARCAGAPLAQRLAMRGLDVCLVDRATFPSDTPSTHGIQPIGTAELDRLGVLEELLAVTNPIERATIVLDDVRVEVDDIGRVLGAPMLNIRRVTLDAVLVDAARRAGATVRTGTAVTGLLRDGDRVTGVDTTAGPLRARLVVGADGARSAVARLVGAEEYAQTEMGRVFTWTYYTGVAPEHHRVRIGKLGDTGFLAMPSDHGRFMVATVPSRDRWRRDDREAAFAAELAGWPELAGAVAGAQRDAPIRAMPRCRGFFRRSAGPGWALVGDAGHFKDPTPGQGIADALRQGARLADAVSAALAPAQTDDAPLDAWWRWRDRDAWEMYWFAYDLGLAGETPLLLREGQRRIGAEPRRVEALMHVLNHDLLPSRLLTPAFGLTTAASALRRHPARRAEVLRETGGLVREELRRAWARPRGRRNTLVASRW